MLLLINVLLIFVSSLRISCPDLHVWLTTPYWSVPSLFFPTEHSHCWTLPRWMQGVTRLGVSRLCLLHPSQHTRVGPGMLLKIGPQGRRMLNFLRFFLKIFAVRNRDLHHNFESNWPRSSWQSRLRCAGLSLWSRDSQYPMYSFDSAWYPCLF